MDLVGVFVAAFVLELFVAQYTLAVARQQMQMALLCSALSGILGSLVTVVYVHEPVLMFVAVGGEVLGTYVILKRAKRNG